MFLLHPLFLFFIFILIIGYTIYEIIIEPKLISQSLLLSKYEARAQQFGLILDMRTPKEREQLGYYPNSIPVSLETIHTEVPFLLGEKPNQPSPKTSHILIYSNGDYRAKKAAKILYNIGYHNVKYINETYLSLLPGSQ
jgi:rhodanese-related sulfurtransferase